MAIKTSEVYFTGSNGKVWDNATIGNALTGAGAGIQTGTAPILSGATSLTLNWNISIVPSALAGALCVALSSIDIIFPDGTSKNLYTVFYGGCTFPVMCGAPGGNSGSLDLTSYLSQFAGQNITLQAKACGYPGSSNIEWSMTAFLTTTETITPAVVNVNVTGPNGAISGASVVMDDTSTGESYTGTTDSSGNVSFNQMNVGDDVAMTVEASGYNTVKETISIDYSTTSVSVTMTAVAFGIPADLASVGKYILVAAGVIGGAAVTYEVAKAFKNREGRPEYEA